jgi:hypothetical protein
MHSTMRGSLWEKRGGLGGSYFCFFQKTQKNNSHILNSRRTIELLLKIKEIVWKEIIKWWEGEQIHVNKRTRRHHIRSKKKIVKQKHGCTHTNTLKYSFDKKRDNNEVNELTYGDWKILLLNRGKYFITREICEGFLFVCVCELYLEKKMIFVLLRDFFVFQFGIILLGCSLRFNIQKHFIISFSLFR